MKPEIKKFLINFIKNYNSFKKRPLWNSDAWECQSRKFNFTCENCPLTKICSGCDERNVSFRAEFARNLLNEKVKQLEFTF